ncbi:unnamed protein product [Hymenolepis diminuta]|uniref:Cystatin domain-containing protein n=1 Tax=Hymenolepis diminuta TaxID=6216 RepID=A0A0R3S7S0_HYMDI|nr:unnamed protein product [Hymenolepis diminuta]VUZ46153.1 unnamed protein product [Hymenolepis diminuta]
MRFSIFFAISCIFTLAFACPPTFNDEDNSLESGAITTKPSNQQTMPGGIIKVTEEDMNDPLFQTALAAAVKKLDDANDCHNFKFEKVLGATKQVVSGVKYIIRLEVKPIFNGIGKEECYCSCYRNFDDAQKVEVSLWLQPWISEQPKSITFTSEGNLGADGKFSIS